MENTKKSNIVLKPLVKANPCRKGTFCFAQVEAALHSKTVAEAQRKLATRKDNPTKKRRIEIGWMVRNKIVALRKAA